MRAKPRKEMSDPRVDIARTQLVSILWQTGIAVAVLAALARGFNWLNF